MYNELIDLFNNFISGLNNLENGIELIILQNGFYSYLFVGLLIFFDTIIFFSPFLPGSYLLILTGSISSNYLSVFELQIIILCLTFVSSLGDLLNYRVGIKIGNSLITNGGIKIYDKDKIEKGIAFFNKYGAKAVIIARFIPIVKNILPLLAGVSRMNIKVFIIFNIIGALINIQLYILVGYFLGKHINVPFDLTLIVLSVILFSLFPFLFKRIKSYVKISSLNN